MLYGVVVGILVGTLIGLTIPLLFFTFQSEVNYFLGFEPDTKISFASDVLLPLVSTLVGAAAGSLVAYKLQMVTADRSREAADVENINAALLALEAQLSDLASLKKVMVKPYENDPFRFLNIPIAMGARAKVTYPDGLAETLMRYKQGELIMRMRMAERLYENVSVLSGNYEKYREIYLSKLRAAGVGQLDISTFKKKLNAAGAETIGQLYIVAEGFIEQLDDCLIDTKICLDELLSVFVDNFPVGKHRSIRIELIKEADDVLKKCPPPIFSEPKDIFERAGYQRVWHDPVDDEKYSIVRLAKKNWWPTAYLKN